MLLRACSPGPLFYEDKPEWEKSDYLTSIDLFEKNLYRLHKSPFQVHAS